MIPETNQANSLFCQRSRANFVAFAAFGRIVLPAIELDGESSLVTVEVEDVRREQMLPSKLAAGKSAIAQDLPHQLFGIGLLVTQRSCELQQVGWQT
jgi:hypothetical protein